MMWTNPRTRKCWSDEEESAFEQLMEVGGLERLDAIRLFRRFRGDLRRALKYAKGRSEPKRDAGLIKARGTKRLKWGFLQTESSQVKPAGGDSGLHQQRD